MEQTLKYISETLKQKGVTVSSPGLMHGKMGIAIFFFHYALFTGNTLFEEYAMELIERLQEQVSQEHGYNYAEGLAGIGAGIEYLAQNKFVEAETDEVLRDYDMLIFHTTVYGDHSDVTLLSGLAGTGRYLLFRIARHSCNNNSVHIPTLNNKMLLIHITDYFERRIPSLKANELDDVYNFLIAMNQANIYPVKTKRLLKIFSFDNTETLIQQSQRKIEMLFGDKISGLSSGNQEKKLSKFSSGLYGGLAGIGLYLLSKLDKRHEKWMNLI